MTGGLLGIVGEEAVEVRWAMTRIPVLVAQSWLFVSSCRGASCSDDLSVLSQPLGAHHHEPALRAADASLRDPPDGPLAEQRGFRRSPSRLAIPHDRAAGAGRAPGAGRDHTRRQIS